VQVIETTDRAAVGELISHPEYVDVIVPRGGKSLIERISRDAKVPTIKHLDGICHVYIDARRPRQGDPHRRQREDPALLAVQHDGDAAGHAAIAPRRAAAAGRDLRRQVGGAARLRSPPAPRCVVPDALPPATDEDWRTEYLAPILSIRIVDGPRRGDRPHRGVRLAAHRRDRHRGPRARCASCARSIPPR
jgi:glutamate-5-semialdehyde dehydrogenase